MLTFPKLVIQLAEQSLDLNAQKVLWEEVCGELFGSYKCQIKSRFFGWQACCNILPTRANLTKKQIIKDNRFVVCKTEPETRVHALWNCGLAKDIWAGCCARLQKCRGGYEDLLQLMEDIIARLSTDELELFLVQAWFIWHQRNAMIHGKHIQAPGILNKRAADFMEEHRRAKTRLSSNSPISSPCRWRPPPPSRFKLNFDTAIFKEDDATGMGTIIRNEKAEMMAALSAKGPSVTCSEEAEVLAIRRAVEFAMECGFSKVVVEGDNQMVMSAIQLSIQDVLCMLSCFRWLQVLSCFRCYVCSVIWMEDSPPPAIEALYFDSISV